MSGSDYPRPSRRTSLPSLGGTTASTGFSLPERAGASRSGQGTFRVAIPLSTACSLSVGTVGSPRFLGNPTVDMPCSSTPAGRRAPGPTARPCCLPCMQNNVGPRDDNSFVAQSHGLSTRCLRFVGMVTASQRKTRFRLLAKLGRMGLVTHWVSSKGFNHRCFLQRVSSFSRLILAHLH